MKRRDSSLISATADRSARAGDASMSSNIKRMWERQPKATSVPCRQPHRKAALRSQCHRRHRLGIDVTLEAEPLHHGRTEERRLHHRERVADADAWPAAEGEVRQLGQLLLEIGAPTLRPEALRIFVEARIMMKVVRAQP